jgi:hypothetical protein
MPKSFCCLAQLLLLLVPGAARAEVKIAAACRVKNRPPGRCGWCALETLARHHGLKALYGLTEEHPSLCCPRSLEEPLAKMGIPYRIQYPGCRDAEILRYAIREGLGAAVGLRGPYPGAEKHIVTLVDLGEGAVKVIDPDDADLRTRQMSLGRFLRRWDGFALVLEPGAFWARKTGAGRQLCCRPPRGLCERRDALRDYQPCSLLTRPSGLCERPVAHSTRWTGCLVPLENVRVCSPAPNSKRPHWS